jgi:tRNA-Thr(GGU) m(6)t(6)A37 methyltransferase TsaA
MQRRPGPGAVELVFIGHVQTPYTSATDCPHQPWTSPAEAILHIVEPFVDIVEGITVEMRTHVLWWADRANRTLQRRRPHDGAQPLGVCAGRGVDRPNPVGLTLVEILAVEGPDLTVRGMDCLNGSPLIDIKPALAVPDKIFQ